MYENKSRGLNQLKLRIMINKLEKYFIGTGEVKGFVFSLVKESHNAYLYRVQHNLGTDNFYYEVFLKQTIALCLDFVTKQFSQTEFKEVYPKSEAFGNCAWTFRDSERAKSKFYELTQEARINSLLSYDIKLATQRLKESKSKVD